jgi:hypothetical protein
MRRIHNSISARWLAVLAIGCAFATSPVIAELNQPPEGFTALFDGQTLAGWWGAKTEDPRTYMALSQEELRSRQETSREDIRKHWRIEEGQLVNDGQGLYLTTDKFFGDFELRLEYKTVPGADSGIYLRGIPQVQIWDYTDSKKFARGADKGSGGLWNNPAGAPGKDPLVLADKPFGQWNAFRIVMVGERVTVWLNDQLVVDHARMHNYYDRNLPAGQQQPLPRVGPIQLQTHGGEIRWRNIFLREISSDEANEILAAKHAEGFQSVFNGRDLTGWSGAVEDYTVEDGCILCKPEHGGTLFTKDQFADFSVRLEFLLPPAGNNGLAIRYPGEGHGTWDSFCELQVLDDGHPQYNDPDHAKFYDLKPHQAHGSVYARVPAHRGYLRPTGQWNFQESTIVGSTVSVELNGFLILDVDVSQVDPETFIYPIDRFSGRGVMQGHFGFNGHNDPVRFRAIRIKRL